MKAHELAQLARESDVFKDFDFEDIEVRMLSRAEYGGAFYDVKLVPPPKPLPHPRPRGFTEPQRKTLIARIKARFSGRPGFTFTPGVAGGVPYLRIQWVH